MTEYKIGKGGKLISNKYTYDRVKKENECSQKDITNDFIQYLFEPCQIEDDVTLGDIFDLINNDLESLDKILKNCWAKELVSEGLIKSEIQKEDDPDKIEYLILSKSISFDGQRIEGININFHGIGYEYKEDTEMDWGEVRKKGSRVENYALDFTSPNKIINCPIKLDENLTIWNEDFKDKSNFGNKNTYLGVDFTLGEIIHGILWELSFHGSPEKRDKQNKEIFDTIKGIEDGTIETFPMDLNEDE